MLFSEDTSPEARAMLIESYRAMTPERRFQVALDASEAMRAMIRADISTRYPDSSEEERQERFLRRCFGDSLIDEWLRSRPSTTERSA